MKNPELKNQTVILLFCAVALAACTDNTPLAAEAINNYYKKAMAGRDGVVPVYGVSDLELTEVGDAVVDSARLEILQFSYNRFSKMQNLRSRQIDDANLKLEVLQQSLDPSLTAGEVDVGQLKSELQAFTDSMSLMTRKMEAVRQRLTSTRQSDKKFYRASFNLNRTMNGVEEKASERTTLLLDENFRVLDMPALLEE